MKYYSEVTKEMYNSEKELVAAERKKAIEDAKKEEVAKVNKAEFDKLKRTYEEASKAYSEAGEAADKIITEAEEKASKLLDEAKKKYNDARVAYVKACLKDRGTYSYYGYTEDEALNTLAKMIGDFTWFYYLL